MSYNLHEHTFKSWIQQLLTHKKIKKVNVTVISNLSVYWYSIHLNLEKLVFEKKLNDESLINLSRHEHEQKKRVTVIVYNETKRNKILKFWSTLLVKISLVKSVLSYWKKLSPTALNADEILNDNVKKEKILRKAVAPNLYLKYIY